MSLRYLSWIVAGAALGSLTVVVAAFCLGVIPPSVKATAARANAEQQVGARQPPVPAQVSQSSAGTQKTVEALAAERVIETLVRWKGDDESTSHIGSVLDLGGGRFVVGAGHCAGLRAVGARAWVTLHSGIQAPGTFAAVDRATDLTVIALDTPVISPRLVLSRQRPSPGFLGLVIGAPHGVQSVGFGLVLSSKERQLRLAYHAEPGNSGGPVTCTDLSDAGPHLVGILVSGSLDGRESFAVQVDDIERIVSASMKRSASALPAPTVSTIAHQVQATEFGAAWCGACHQARSYLAKKSVQTRWVDVHDPSGATQLQEVRRRGGIRGNAIPVTEFRGSKGYRIVEGFSPASFDRAIQEVSH